MLALQSVFLFRIRLDEKGCFGTRCKDTRCDDRSCAPGFRDDPVRYLGYNPSEIASDDATKERGAANSDDLQRCHEDRVAASRPSKGD